MWRSGKMDEMGRMRRTRCLTVKTIKEEDNLMIPRRTKIINGLAM